jgi:hypothetical protein
MRQLVYEFREHCCHSGESSPFFASSKSGDRQSRRCRHCARSRPDANLPSLRIAGS